MTGVSANSELPKSSEKHVLCLLALLQGAAPMLVSPEAGQPSGKISQVSVRQHLLPHPFSPPRPPLAAAAPPSLPPSCPFVLRAPGLSPGTTRRAGGRGDTGLGGRPGQRGGLGAQPQPVPSPRRASSEPLPWPAHGHLLRVSSFQGSFVRQRRSEKEEQLSL